MKRQQSLVAIFLLIPCLAFSNPPQVKSGIEKDVIISGIIMNYEVTNSPRTIKIIPSDFFDADKIFVGNINEDGTFKFKFPVPYIQEAAIVYGNNSWVSLLCVPGDSLTIEIDNNLTRNRNSVHEYVKFSETKTGKTSWFINKFKAELPDENYMGIKANEAEENLLPEEFVNYIMKREREYANFSAKFNKENETSQLFDIWINDRLQYESWHDLMRYRWTHPVYNGIPQDSFILPDSYFAFLNDYDMDDNKLFSGAHVGFLDELMMHVIDENAKKATLDEQAPAHEWMSYQKGMLEINTSGFTREMFVTKLYIALLKQQSMDLFEAVYDPDFTKQPYFLNIINEEYKTLKEYLANQNTGNINLSTIDDSTVAGLIETVTQKYKNKVIYIDFWAPWCGPCIQEMPDSKAIQEHFKDDDVVFLFLANRCEADAWKATIANKGLTGEHILLTDDQYNVLAGLLGIAGIPHYTLIDKNGSIVLKDAPRPSDKEKLITEINRQINK